MNRTTVLVAVEPRLLRESLCAGLAGDARIAIASEGADPLEVLASAARIDADVVIVTSSESAGIPPLATHLFAEFPEIAVVAICQHTGQVRVHRQVVTSEKIPAESLEHLVAAICAGPGLSSPAALADAFELRAKLRCCGYDSPGPARILGNFYNGASR